MSNIISKFELNRYLDFYYTFSFKVIPLNISLDKNGDKILRFPFPTWKRDFTKGQIYSLIDKKTFNGLAIKTGEISNLWVLDIDHDNGISGLDNLKSNKIILPVDTPCAKTQSVGYHYYFKFPEQFRDYSTGSDKPNLIDWRGKGGLIIAPPSQITKSCFYEWINPLTISNFKLPPSELIQWILNHRRNLNPDNNMMLLSVKENKNILDLTEGQKNRFYEALKDCFYAPKGTRSGKDYSFCRWCRKMDLSPDNVWPIVKDVGKFKERGQKYFMLTWKKAGSK